MSFLQDESHIFFLISNPSQKYRVMGEGALSNDDVSYKTYFTSDNKKVKRPKTDEFVRSDNKCIT